MMLMMLVCRVFGVTLDYDDDDHEGDQTSPDDEELLTENTDNPSNLFSSATGRLSIPHIPPSCSWLVFNHRAQFDSWPGTAAQ